MPIPETIETNSTENTDSLRGTARPYVRFWARLIDSWIYSMVSFIIFGIIFFPIVAFLPPFSGSIILFTVYIAVAIFLESLCLSKFGATLGKWIFRIQVKNKNGEKLSFNQASLRTLRLIVRVFGLPLCFVILFPIAAFFVLLISLTVAWFKVVGTGESSWDRDGTHLVHHQKIGPLRSIGAALFLTVILSTFFIKIPV